MNDDDTLDLLLGRILDRCAAPADWDSFATLARARPESWGQLLLALRSEQGLQRGAEPALAIADRIEVPDHAASLATSFAAADAAAYAAPVLPMTAARARRPWTGWAAAAVLAFAWAGSSLLSAEGASRGAAGIPGAGIPGAGAGPDTAPVASAPNAVPDTSPAPAAAPAATPAELRPGTESAGQGRVPLLAQSGDAAGPRLRDPNGTAAPSGDDLHGDIVGQLPLQLVSSVASPDGNGLDVVYVRPVLERARVSGMYSLGLDDAGRPAPVSIKPASLLLAGN